MNREELIQECKGLCKGEVAGLIEVLKEVKRNCIECTDSCRKCVKEVSDEVRGAGRGVGYSSFNALDLSEPDKVASDLGIGEKRREALDKVMEELGNMSAEEIIEEFMEGKKPDYEGDLIGIPQEILEKEVKPEKQKAVQEIQEEADKEQKVTLDNHDKDGLKFSDMDDAVKVANENLKRTQLPVKKKSKKKAKKKTAKKKAKKKTGK